MSWGGLTIIFSVSLSFWKIRDIAAARLRGDEVVRGDAGGLNDVEGCEEMGTKVLGLVMRVGDDFEERVRAAVDRVRVVGEV